MTGLSLWQFRAISMGTFGDRSREYLRRFGSTAKAAAQLTAKQAERTKLVNWTLPNAYAEFGKQLYAAEQLRSELATFYDAVDKTQKSIQSLESASASRPKGERFSEKAKAMAEDVRDKTHAKALQLTLRNAFADLGKAAFETNCNQFGETTATIEQALARLARLDQECATLSQASTGVVTAPRLAIGVAVGVALMGIYFGFIRSDGVYSRPTGASYSSNYENRIPSFSAVSTSNGSSKIAAFRLINQKLKSFPNRFAGDTVHERFNSELKALIEKFNAIPFDAAKSPKEAEQMIEEWEAVEGEYSGHLINLFAAEIGEMAAELLDR